MRALPLLSLALSALPLVRPASGAHFASEYELLRALPRDTFVALTRTGEPDAQGLVGPNRKLGAWNGAGAQRSGCWNLIAAAVLDDGARAEDAWRSIAATFAHQLDDGGFRSEPNPNRKTPPTFDDRVETAYFYLQELGHAILVVRASPLEPQFRARFAELEPKIRRAMKFVLSGYDGIIKKVSHTPNRLLIAAKAFGLCGVVLRDAELEAASRRLVGVALGLRDADGVFIENGGRDSSYNAVSLLMGQVLALYQPNPPLEAAMVRAMAWERTRIQPDGEVTKEGNTRTGLGQEKNFRGGIKKINVREIALALCYYGQLHDDPPAVALAAKVFAHGNGEAE